MLTAFRAWTTSQLRVEEEAKGKNSHELKAFYEDRYLSILNPETSTILIPIFSDIWNSSSENGEFKAWLCAWKVRRWENDRPGQWGGSPRLREVHRHRHGDSEVEEEIEIQCNPLLTAARILPSSFGIWQKAGLLSLHDGWPGDIPVDPVSIRVDGWFPYNGWQKASFLSLGNGWPGDAPGDQVSIRMDGWYLYTKHVTSDR